MPSVKIVERRDIDVILEILNELKDKIATVIFSNKKRRGAVAGQKQRGSSRLRVFEFFLEREHLLSKFSGDPTVGILRSKKESCSTR